MTHKPALTLPHILTYGCFALPLAFAGIPLYMYAPDFYTTEFGLSLGTIGLILFIIRLIDAVQDPLIGAFCDRYNKQRGLIMSLSILVMSVSFFMLFHPYEAWLTLWFCLSLFLLTTSFSFLTINLNMLGGIWTKDKKAKTKITSVRESFTLIGVLTASALPAVFAMAQDKQESFHSLSLVFIAILLICSLIFMAWFYRFEEPATKGRHTHFSPFALFKTKSKNLKTFYFIYLISMLASAIPLILVIFFVRDKLGAEALLGHFLAVYFLCGVVSIPIWHLVARHKGKLFTWSCSICVATTSFIWAYFLEAGDLYAYAVICAVSGAALGAELIIPPAILSDIIDDNGSHHQATTQFAILAFLSKIALTLATAVILPTLEIMGYQPNTDTPCCNDDISHALSLTYALIPCVIKMIALYLLWSWSQKQGDHNETFKTQPINGSLSDD